MTDSRRRLLALRRAAAGRVVIHARIAGQSRPMCCHGCRAAAEWIEQLGLGDYYRLRTQPAQKPDLNAATLAIAIATPGDARRSRGM